MFWADRVAQELRDKGPQWVDDMKTPSGRIHVGALRGVIIHDLVFRALKDQKNPAKYTYIIDDHDPMDSLPVYLDQKKYSSYMGVPLNKIPAPDNSNKSFAQYFSEDFISVFEKLGCQPEILWAWDFYTSGKMDENIKIALDNAEKIQDIYQKVSGSQKKEAGWYPFQVICQKCGKLGTTKVTAWDGKEVTYECLPDLVKWAQGCGHRGKISPFSGTGKLPWKVEWPAVWSSLGVTIEGEGKDLASRGGARDTANALCREVFKITPPYDLPYEHFLIGGKKMSTSKGFGASAQEMAEILPPQILRFLMVKTNYKEAINFDPEGETIPQLFDDYDRFAKEFFDKGNQEMARVFELSQIDSVPAKKITFPRFRDVATFIQMPGVDLKKQFPDVDPEILEERMRYSKIWLEKYAPEEKKFTVQKNLPATVKKLSSQQKELLLKISQEFDKKWQPEDFQNHIYQLGKSLNLSSAETFQAIYLTLLGKTHGPKASWLILSLEKSFVQNRFNEVLKKSKIVKNDVNIKKLNKPEIFYIDNKLKDAFPSISVGIAVIKGVDIKKTDDDLEKEKKELLSSLQGLSTEKLGQYPEIISYRKLYKEMGIDWHSRRPSPEALLRRVVLNKDLYSINTCVDAYNLVVMRNKVSVGAFNLDNIHFPTVLRFAKEGEEILLLGDNNPTKYKKGEVAYFDETGGYNIDFNYRDAQRTAVQLDTKNLYINVDGVYEITPQKVEEVLEETCLIIIKYCGGKVELFGVETK